MNVKVTGDDKFMGCSSSRGKKGTEVIDEDREWFGKWKKENTKEARMEDKKSRQNAKRVISSANEKKQKECANDTNDYECQNESRWLKKDRI